MLLDNSDQVGEGWAEALDDALQEQEITMILDV